MPTTTTGLSIRGSRRAGAGGGLILLLLIGVALMLVLMFGNFGGNKSYMQNVAGAKQKGNETGVDVLAYSLVQMITAVRATDPEAVPTTFDQLGVSPANFTDPWGSPIRWEFDDATRPKNVTVISDGPDNQPGTEDDVRIEKPLPM